MNKRIKIILSAIGFSLLLSGCISIDKIEAPEIPGITERAGKDWDTIVIDSRYVLINNVWNKRASYGAYFQEVYSGNAEGIDFFGWDWNWSGGDQVVAYPEISCGDSPWSDDPGLAPEFPYQAGTKSLSVSFAGEIEAAGVYNMAFDIWAISGLPNTSKNISHEIMIWNANKTSNYWGWAEMLGEFTSSGAVFDVYKKSNHGDASGGSKVQWTYIAFVSRDTVLKATWNIDDFLNFLIGREVLSTNNYICNVELGNEVFTGKGIVKLTDFTVTVTHPAEASRPFAAIEKKR